MPKAVLIYLPRQKDLHSSQLRMVLSAVSLNSCVLGLIPKPGT